MRRLLAICGALEIVTGLTVAAVPALAAEALFGAAVAGAGAAIARLAGIALIALGIACWPPRERARSATAPALGMFAYNVLVAMFLTGVGVRGGSTGVLLWPAAALHGGITTVMLVFALRSPRTGHGD
jgi:hypothetical protein